MEPRNRNLPKDQGLRVYVKWRIFGLERHTGSACIAVLFHRGSGSSS